MDARGESATSYTEKCPLRYALDKIGGKWKIPVLWELNVNGTMRFGQIRREVHGVTSAMLSSTLRELIGDGLVSRVQYDEMPLRVEYSLTEAGESLFPVLSQMAEWGLRQQELAERPE